MRKMSEAALTRAEGYLGRAIALAYHSKFSCGGAKFHDAEYEGYVDTFRMAAGASRLWSA